MCRILLLIAVIWAATPGETPAANEPREKPMDRSIDTVAAMLAEKPAGFGRPVTDRAAWEALAGSPAYAGVVARAEKLLAQPLPETTDELFLDYSRNGNRTRWQRVAGQRRGRISQFALAECIENKGRFLKAFTEAIEAVCAETTWVMPAHDSSLRNFHGQAIDIDLGAAMLAWNIATADYLLSDKLPARTRKLIRENVSRRIFEPYLAMVAGQRKPNWWMNTTNNWNAVCLAGVTGSALALEESPRRRAAFILAAEKYSANFLNGFTADGYCSEGLGYWGYGFGHYVLLAETVHQATGGGVDLLAKKAARTPATFPWRIAIIGGVSPAFADCGVSQKPSKSLVHFLRRRYGLGADPANDKMLISPGGQLYEAMMYSFKNSATTAPPAHKTPEGPGLRDWFADAGVLIARPAGKSNCRLGVALKGGHNAEHHNHNDVGSYVVVVGDKPVLADPGAEVYTKRTFSSKRYVSKVLNSFGHPVPLVAGQLQQTGAKARGKVLSQSFTDEADTLVLDLRSAYKVAGLTKLQRTFTYSRSGAGSLTVTDEVAMESPGEFETALVTFGTWKKLDDGTLLITDGKQAVRASIETGGAAYTLDAVEIKEDIKAKSLPTRIAIKLTKPTTAAKVTVKITPATVVAGK